MTKEKFSVKAEYSISELLDLDFLVVVIFCKVLKLTL